MFDLINDGEWIGRYDHIDGALAEVAKWRADFEDEMANEEFGLTENDWNWFLIEITQVALTGDQIRDRLVKNST